MDRLGHPRTNILAYTMPGFATSSSTKSAAHDLMAALGVTADEISIDAVSRQTLEDIGHPYAEGVNDYDVTFENVQAGARTATLFRLANHQGALVLGTGDLSELALGWCTYGVGDHMSHYNRQRLRFENPDPAPDPLGRSLTPVRRRRVRGLPPHPRHRDIT